LGSGYGPDGEYLSESGNGYRPRVGGHVAGSSPAPRSSSVKLVEGMFFDMLVELIFENRKTFARTQRAS